MAGTRKIIVGISGGSGSIYALSLLVQLRQLGFETHVVMSRMGAFVLRHECDVLEAELEEYGDCFYDNDNLAASIAGGAFKTFGMVVVPCSMKTLAAVANGFSESLLTRAADVALKERRPLVLVTRESPLSAVHIENMLKVTQCGAIVMPAAPGFYNHPKNIAEMVTSFSGRILDSLGIEHELIQRWNGNVGKLSSI